MCKPTKTKSCPYCRSTELVGLTSSDEVICNGCKRLSPWTLKPGQPSVLIERKVGGIE